MPFYEYECPACRARVEEMRKMKDRNKSVTCTNCGAKMERNTLSTGAFKLSWREI